MLIYLVEVHREAPKLTQATFLTGSFSVSASSFKSPPLSAQDSVDFWKLGVSLSPGQG